MVRGAVFREEMDLQGDAAEIVVSFLPVPELAALFAVSSSWADNVIAQYRFHMDRLAARIVQTVRKAEHNARTPPEEEEHWPTILVEEQMRPQLFHLLFRRRAEKKSDAYELQLSRPDDILDALPSLPVVVRNVRSNAPAPPLCPLIAHAGYMDGHIRYEPAASKVSLSLRSCVVKVAAYWEHSLENLRLAGYPAI